MNALSIYDPAMCCATGVCGVDADTVLITFSSDIEWLRKNGVEVSRFNLAQEPSAFMDNPMVKAEINEHGDSCLPLLVCDGKVVSRGKYPDRAQLGSWMDVESVDESVVPSSASSGCCGASGSSGC